MGNKTKKAFVERAFNLYAQAHYGIARLKALEILGPYEDGGMNYRIFVNEKKETVAIVLEAGDRAVVKPFHDDKNPGNGDKFDVYTGVIMGLWKLLTGVPSYKVHELMTEIVPEECADAATTNLIKTVVENVTGIDKESFITAYEEAKKENAQNPYMDVVLGLRGDEIEQFAQNIIARALKSVHAGMGMCCGREE